MRGPENSRFEDMTFRRALQSALHFSLLAGVFRRQMGKQSAARLEQEAAVATGGEAAAAAMHVTARHLTSLSFKMDLQGTRPDEDAGP